MHLHVILKYLQMKNLILKKLSLRIHIKNVDEPKLESATYNMYHFKLTKTRSKKKRFRINILAIVIFH